MGLRSMIHPFGALSQPWLQNSYMLHLLDYIHLIELLLGWCGHHRRVHSNKRLLLNTSLVN